jgi:hypothetical protein
LTRIKKTPGRKPKVITSEACGRAGDLKLILETNRERINWARLLAIGSKEDLEEVLKAAHDRAREKLLYKPELLLATLKDKKFPRHNRDAQEQFIADSLAAEGRVSIRRSRDIVQQVRSAGKKRGKILRREFYVECSCGYKGPALHDACPDCGAEVSYLDFATGFAIHA